MSGQARNDEQLKRLLMPKIKEAVDLLVQKIWNENRELVRTIVYEAYSPTRYNRTGEFKEAWSTDSTMNEASGKAQGSFYYDPDKLTPGDDDPDSPRYGQHVSAIDRFLMTDYLAEVIYQGKAGPAFGHGVTSGPWHSKRDVWAQLEKKIGRVKLKSWMKECFDKVGLPVQAYGTPWGMEKW